LLWAYVTARFVDVVTNADPDDAQFKNRVDDLNVFLTNNSVTNEPVHPGAPPDLRSRLREYMYSTRFLKRSSARARLQTILSPNLQSEVVGMVGIARGSNTL
jgi:hypothetical protein